jgi:microcystin-dependent protein
LQRIHEQEAALLNAAPLIAEIRIFAFGYAPIGWDPCDGRLLPIAEHQPLFAILGWRYGGDGWTTFALPDMRAEASPDLVPAIATDGCFPARTRKP